MIETTTTSPTVEEVLEEGLAAIGREVKRLGDLTKKGGLLPELGLQLCRYVVSTARIAREKREGAKDDTLNKVTDAKLDAMLKRQLSETYGVSLADLETFLQAKRSARVS